MAEETVVITDTSVLINFLVLDKVTLLPHLPNKRFVVTDHVRAEVTEHHQEQLQRLNLALSTGALEEISVTDLAEVELFAQLTATGLGIGECSAIAVAVHRNLSLAIDDKTARKRVQHRWPDIAVLTSETLVVELIRQGVLTVEEADGMKTEWELNHRFSLKLTSFAERLT